MSLAPGNIWLQVVYKLDVLSVAMLLQKNSVALSPQANYTDWANVPCRRNLVPTFVDRGVSRGQRGGSPAVVNLSFLDRNRYFSFKQLLIYPHKGLEDPVPDPLLFRKSGSAKNWIRDLWVSSQELWPLDHRGGRNVTTEFFNSKGLHMLSKIILWRVWSNAVVARQRKVKHFHGYAHHSVLSRCMVA
jgi:hypothetical protein